MFSELWIPVKQFSPFVAVQQDIILVHLWSILIDAIGKQAIISHMSSEAQFVRGLNKQLGDNMDEFVSCVVSASFTCELMLSQVVDAGDKLIKVIRAEKASANR